MKAVYLPSIVHSTASPCPSVSIVSLYVLHSCVAHLSSTSCHGLAVRVSEGKVDQPIQGPCQWVKYFVCRISKRIVMPKKGRRSHTSIHDRVGRASSSRVWVCWIIQRSCANGLIQVSSNATYAMHSHSKLPRPLAWNSSLHRQTESYTKLILMRHLTFNRSELSVTSLLR